ncbi:MAG: hypothetical protein COB02_06485 [Candidatus Cloacimonadota bacterium]|nr:MAG: hypothetical protein COB02_06485 [Candidatus Cloacimonadota bacterium]
MYDDDFIAEFINESKEQLSTIIDDILKLEECFAEVDNGLINKIFRTIHSLKGASGFLGYDNMTEISHAFETLLSKVRDNTLNLSSNLIDCFLGAVDLINIMLNNISNCRNVSVVKQVKLLESFLDDKPPKTNKKLTTESLCEKIKNRI